MRCVWCDSEYTFYGGEKIPFDDILTKLERFGSNLVEVTGGEPLAQKNVFPFISTLCNRNYEVLIETGNFVSTEEVDTRASIILDVKCPASGESERNHWDNLARLRQAKDEVKFVVAHVEGANKPTLNGAAIGADPVTLKNGDLLELAGTQMQFVQA